MTEQTFESIMETVCSICHRPYVETDQEELDAVCADCPVEKKLREVMSHA